MTVRRLIRIIKKLNDIDRLNIKVNFYSVNLLCERLSNPIFFSCINDEERHCYERCNNKSAFVSTTPSINIPDLTIREIINILECDGTGLLAVTKKMVNDFFSTKISDDIVIFTFLFLHEVGHWDQFHKMSYNVEDFTKLDCEESEQNHNKLLKTISQINKRKHNGEEISLTKKERFLLEQLSKEYRNIPKEKEADNYAFKHLRIILSDYQDELIKS